MRTRLAMMNCRGPHTTPWMNPQGGERAIRVLHLVDGERVFVETDSGAQVLDGPGEHPFATTARFRFRKERDNVDGSPTMVEVIYA